MIHSAVAVVLIFKRLIINIYIYFQQVFQKGKKQNNIKYVIQGREGSLIIREYEVHHMTTIFTNLFRMSLIQKSKVLILFPLKSNISI